MHHFTFKPSRDWVPVTRIDGRCWSWGTQFYVSLFGGQLQSTVDYTRDDEGFFTIGWINAEIDVRLTVGSFSSYDETECIAKYLATLPAGAAEHIRPSLTRWFT